jgi:hypothetical protein
MALGAVISLTVSSVADATATAGTTYQHSVGSLNIVLGPQSNPTEVTITKPLAPGLYLIQALVGIVMGPVTNGTQDGAVCAVNDKDGVMPSLFGSTGNGSSVSGTGPNGIYGTASMAGTWNLKTANDPMRIFCNATDPGQGTYVDGLNIEATVIPATSTF